LSRARGRRKQRRCRESPSAVQSWTPPRVKGLAHGVDASWANFRAQEA
jgi:hypothetical protein